ncbi:MAG: cell wall-binding repeat-containing protein [Actinomycetota bacterium]|nr:cell wall-binding repeat-containing protein [Actinomycetota bacterium]
MDTRILFGSRRILSLAVVASLVLSVAPVTSALAHTETASVSRPAAALKDAKAASRVFRAGVVAEDSVVGTIVPLGADDTIGGAVALPASPVAGTLDAATDKTDVYSVTLAAGKRLRVAITGSATLNADAYLYFPGTVDAEITSAIAGTLGDAFPKLFKYDAMTAGEYYIAVDTAAGSGSYSVTWEIMDIPSGADDDISGSVSAPSPVIGDLNYLTDIDDVYRITIGEGQRLVASLEGDAGTDFDLLLYGKDATGLGDTWPIGGSSTAGSTESFVFEAPTGQAGDYYIDVHCVSGTGEYTMEWAVSDVPAGAFETAGDAFSLPFNNGTRAGRLDRLTDTNDYYKWTLSAGQRFEATLTADAGTDFDIYLYGPGGGEPVAFSNDIGSSEYLIYDISIAGSYYIEVVSFSGSGAYNLEYKTTMTPAWATTDRQAGGDRYTTAMKLSASAYAAGSVDTVVLATGADFPDALSAAGVAGAYRSPVLLTKPLALPDGLLAEITRLGAHNVVIMGGAGAVGLPVERALIARGLAVTRIAGNNRYSTSAAAARRVAALKGASFAKIAFVARGDDFADALAVAPFAYSQGFPVLLTKTSTLPPECSAVITTLGIREIYVVGGTGAVATNVFNALNYLPTVTTDVVRLAGLSRYDTATVIAQKGLDLWWGNAGYVGIATGRGFADALGGGAVCGARGGVLLLTDPLQLSAPVSAFMTRNVADIVDTEICGGPGAVSGPVEEQINSLMSH